MRLRGVGWRLPAVGVLAVAALGTATAAGIAGTAPATRGGIPGHMVTWDYTIRDAPVHGLPSMMFSVKVDKSTFRNSYFWAQQAWYLGRPTARLTIGLQPYGTGPSGRHQRQVLFSVYGVGVARDSSNCAKGSGGGPGASCAVRVDWQPGVKYGLRISSSGPEWTGTFKNLKTGKSVTIGAFTVLSRVGLLQPEAGGYASYYGQVSSCPALPSEVETNYLLEGPDGLTGPVTYTRTSGSGKAPHINCARYAHTYQTRQKGEINKIPA